METCTTHKSFTEPGRDCTFNHIFLKKITELWNKINKTIYIIEHVLWAADVQLQFDEGGVFSL